MLNTILSIVAILHGLVHLWYVLLLSKIVHYQSDMGWTGDSWLLTGSVEIPLIRYIGIILYTAVTVLFVTSGITLLTGSNLASKLLVYSAILSSVLILFFFDGQFNMLVQKGLIGLILNLTIILLAISAYLE